MGFRSKIVIFFVCFANLSLAQAAEISFHEKPSLKEYLGGLQGESEISAIYKESLKLDREKLPKKEAAKVLKLVRTNAKLLKNWKQTVSEGQPFWRGEIEDEKILNQVLVLQQLDFLRVRDSASEGSGAESRETYGRWFKFAETLAYEEASLMGLRLANLVRSLTLDEVERSEKKNFMRWSVDTAWLQWTAQLSAPWPVDRVIMTEAKKIIRGKGTDTAQKMALALQKNTYQTAAKALDEAQGQKVPELQLLIPIWRDKDIEAMKTEINRIESLRLRLAADVYFIQKRQRAKDQQDLIAAGLLRAPLVNYVSGKTFTLSEAAAR